MKCGICGQEDLFSAVMQKPVCSTCVMSFFRGGDPSPGQIAAVRERLNEIMDEYSFVLADRIALWKAEE